MHRASLACRANNFARGVYIVKPNDLAYQDPEDVAGNVIRMVQEIKKHGIGCSVSTLTT